MTSYVTNDTGTPGEGGDLEGWVSEVADWIGSLFSGCAEDNPASWQEHYVTRCLNGERWDGRPCPGTPDPRRLAEAARVDPSTAAGIRSRLQQWNEGWAPTVQEMGEPTFAVLWSFAVAGGIDCYNGKDPGYPAQVWQWAESVTPGWTPPPGSTSPPGLEYDPAVFDQLYTTARSWGRDRAENLLESIAAGIYGAIPQEYRSAIEQGVRDHYTRSAGSAAKAAVPFAIGIGLLLALPRMRKG